MAKLFFSTDGNEAKRLSNLFQQKKLQRLYHGIYSDDLKSPIKTLIRDTWMQIVAFIVPKSILSFRTATDLKPTYYNEDYHIVFVTSSYAKTITLPGLIIKVLKGNSNSYFEQIMPNLARSTLPRLLLENLSSVRGANKGIKTIGQEGVETILAKEMRHRGEIFLNRIRDEAQLISQELGYEKEYHQLNKIISSMLSTNPDSSLQSPYAIAVAKREPYDSKRLTLFENLYLYLKKCSFKERLYPFNSTSLKNLSFYESYFSNFIEGTEFAIDEAEEIVFSGRKIKNRHADSHDILANFRLTSDPSEMDITPNNPSEFLDILKRRHAYLMKERPEKQPGEFKNTINKAGNTLFVEPQDVIGTLCQSFEFYKLLPEGLPRALFIHFIVSEVHPFLDGNGRLSRIMMNAELYRADLYKMIIPIVHRDNYLNGLRQASRDQYFTTYCKVLDQAQAYVATVNWLDYGDARYKLEMDQADKTPNEGLPIFNRALRNLKLSDFA